MIKLEKIVAIEKAKLKLSKLLSSNNNALCDNYKVFFTTFNPGDMEPLYTVSHFGYAPLFQCPHFLTKILESNMLYDNLRIDILSV